MSSFTANLGLKKVMGFFLLLNLFLLNLSYAKNVNDRAGFFSADTVQWAEQQISKLASNQQVFVLTQQGLDLNLTLKQNIMKELPPQFQGVLVYLLKNPKKLMLIPSKSSTWTDQNQLNQIRNTMLQSLKVNNPDQALRDGVTQLIQAASGTQVQKVEAAPIEVKQEEATAFPWQRVFFAGVLILIVFMILKSFLRRRPSSNAYYPRDNYSSHNNYPPNYSNGGGGFLQNVLGGIAGVVAGNWLYDKFFGNSPSIGTDANASSWNQTNPDPGLTENNRMDWGGASGSFDSNSDDWGSSDSSGSDEW